jgi:hypothetical protein
MSSADDISLLRLFVLIRAAKQGISEECLLVEFERRNIHGLTAKALRSILSSLVRRGLIRLVKGDASAFVATRQGQQAATEAGARLSNLMTLLNDRSGQPGDSGHPV